MLLTSIPSQSHLKHGFVYLFLGVMNTLDACNKNVEDKCKTPLTDQEAADMEKCNKAADDFRKKPNFNIHTYQL